MAGDGRELMPVATALAALTSLAVTNKQVLFCFFI